MLSHINRPGQISPWDVPEFVKAIKDTGKKQLVIAGVVTDVCVAFTSLFAKEAGYEAFAVIDSSGTFNEAVRDDSWLRMQAGGVQLMNWFSVACKLGRDRRHDITGMAVLFANRLPSYSHFMDSFNAAQAALEGAK